MQKTPARQGFFKFADAHYTKFCRPLRNHSATWPQGLGLLQPIKRLGNHRICVCSGAFAGLFDLFGRGDQGLRQIPHVGGIADDELQRAARARLVALNHEGKA